MADPRLSTSIVGVDAEYIRVAIDDSTITFDRDQDGGSAQVGLAVAYSGDGEIELVGDGEEVLGKLIKVEYDGYATVQIGGGMTLPGGDSASLTQGKKIVGDLDASSNEGYIREVDTSTAAELGVARGFIHDASDTDNVEVYL